MSTESANPFQAPKAELELPPAVVSQGSLEDAMAGRYDFDIGEVMSEAWQLTKGFKASYWGAAILVYGALFIVTLIGGAVVAVLAGKSPHPVLGGLVNGILSVVVAPLMLGLLMMAVRRAGRLPVSFSTAFQFLDKAGVAVIAMLLTTILTYVGILLLVIPGVYLSIAYLLTFPLIGDRGLSPWAAMETSRKALTRKWFRVFGLLFLTGLLVMLSALPLGIPLIWTLPWGMMVIGVLYRRVFGGGAAPPPGAGAASR